MRRYRVTAHYKDMKLTAVLEAENYDQARNMMRARVNTDTPLFLGWEGQRVIEEGH